MNMWKIAIASMVLATSAFGAVNVKMTQQGGLSADNVATFKMEVEVMPGSSLKNFSIYSDETQPKMDKVLWVGRTTADDNVGKLDQWQAADPPAGGQKMSDTFIDFGTGRKLATQDFGAATYYLGDWKFKVDPAATPVTVVLYAGTYTGSGDGVMPDTSFVITPEPASMMLLAAGAAFFARRRRA